ncbi:pyruvate kinase [Brytella acorum]|uniref:Pyruvate kinase n=1 Tax=Brytella acorum TaxID=2959299 RepID=A0AA35UYY4_9PROT|nr:pyruvate kinase [Brytella acorum]MDF3625150.1 pyruvate kinase [Brytella acorum]CAI9122050.1 pyruvate kinase [Brytella acorum]
MTSSDRDHRESSVRRTKIVATLGPASSSREMIRTLALAGANVFRLNFSHGSHDDHAERHATIRDIEAELDRPIAILADMQGPKLRVGTFANGRITLQKGEHFRLDLDRTPGDNARVCLPHPEILAAAQPGSSLLLDDGKLRLKVLSKSDSHLDTEVMVGGPLSDRKGVNVPDVVLPIPALTAKDRKDLAFALSLGVEYIALSFVQRPEDVQEARDLVDGAAWIMTKLEKPKAMDALTEIVALSDAVMVARGDLGVELPPEEVPLAQKRAIREARRQGKPVVVATQMLESMITSPSPTRAEVSDVSNAVFDGADAVMLSAESAAGDYPKEAVEIMARVVRRVENDPEWRARFDVLRPEHDGSTAGAVAEAGWLLAQAVSASAIVAYSATGQGARRIARERPTCPVLALTPDDDVARRLCLLWGVRAQSVGQEIPIFGVEGLVDQAVELARREDFAQTGDKIVLMAGLPFGERGSTNTLRVIEVS